MIPLFLSEDASQSRSSRPLRKSPWISVLICWTDLGSKTSHTIRRVLVNPWLSQPVSPIHQFLRAELQHRDCGVCICYGRVDGDAARACNGGVDVESQVPARVRRICCLLHLVTSCCLRIGVDIGCFSVLLELVVDGAAFSVCTASWSAASRGLENRG